MEIKLTSQNINLIESDVLLTFVFEEELDELSKFGNPLFGEIQGHAEKEMFTGKTETILSVSSHGLISGYKIYIVGLGKKNEFDCGKIYQSVSYSISKIQEFKPVIISLLLPKYWIDKFSVKETYKAVTESIKLTAYRFLKYKGDKEKKNCREIEQIIIGTEKEYEKLSNGGLVEGLITSDAAIFARDLVNEPSTVTTPEFLAKKAQDIGFESKKKINVEVLDKVDVEKLGMGAFLGVAKGSEELPKFIRLHYKPAKSKKKVVIIGKAITFDTGGLSLKSSEHMETMKMDMAGGAAVLAIFQALPKLMPSLEIVGLIPACENMPSGKSLKPGDILKTISGKTIEVLNTDAEGRLTLADALSYAVIYEKPAEIIDLATLTGACVVSLGEEIAGLWGNNIKLMESLETASKETGEKIWRMPLEKDYLPLIKSSIADLKNIQTGRYGGAITAALFLQEFVDNIPWAHLDIAGPAFFEKGTSLVPKGGSGFGVRLLLEYLISQSG